MSGRQTIAAILTGAIVSQLWGCGTPKYGWEVQEAAPEQVITEQTPERVRVTKVDGARLEVWEPQVGADSLTGRTLPEDVVWMAGTPRPEMVPVSLPLSVIQQIEVPAVSKGQVAGGIAVAAILGAASVVLLGVLVTSAWGEQ